MAERLPSLFERNAAAACLFFSDEDFERDPARPFFSESVRLELSISHPEPSYEPASVRRPPVTRH